MAIIKIPQNFEPRPYQLKLFQAMDGIRDKPDSGVLRALIRWHRQSGKDTACWAYMITRAVREPGNYVYLFPRQSDAKRALWEKIDPITGHSLMDMIPESIRKINQSELKVTISTVDGRISTIRVIGLDYNPDAGRGMSIKGAVLSEFAYQDPAAFKAIQPGLRMGNGWVIFNSTPNGHNHLYELEEAICNNANWFVSELQTLWPERPNYSGLLSSEDILRIRDEDGLSDDEIEQEYGASYAPGIKGTVYMHLLERAVQSKRIGNFPYDDHKWVDTFWDLGIDNNTAIWFRQLDGKRSIFIDYYEANNQDIAHYVQVLKDRGYAYNTVYLPHDAGHRKMTGTGVLKTQAEMLEDCLESAGITAEVVVCPRLDRQTSILVVKSKFSSFYFNDPLVHDGVKKLSLYHYRYDSKRRVYSADPVHDWTSDAADALKTIADADEYEDEQSVKKTLTIAVDYDILA